MEPTTFSSFLNSSEFSIPLGQVILFVVVSSICLMLGRHKLGLLVSFCFAFYWGFVFNRETLVDMLGHSTGLYIYAFCGLAMIGLALISFSQER
ncbi:MAG: hypothetical protein G3M78_14205 [Candidatus Nitrohelix vancouverensis]|uniref:Uncharacterized protein n=1 Tax=Candidatus Nitrohelix vancouverensis TaxID=2705534 RepID=A0A7T0C4Z3_9BACT|nr:MAG: hypothetical protein G3M78_14205 [Candidatus Nitrohelix vancouverensis]